MLPCLALQIWWCCRDSASKARGPFLKLQWGKATVPPHSLARSVWGSLLLLNYNLLFGVCGMNKWFNKYSMRKMKCWQKERIMANSFVFHMVSAKKQLSWYKVSEVGEERPTPYVKLRSYFPYLWAMLFSRQGPQTTVWRPVLSGQGRQGQQGGTASLSSLTSMVQSLKLSTAVEVENELWSSQWIFMMDDYVREQTVYKCQLNVKDLFQCKISTCPWGFV